MFPDTTETESMLSKRFGSLDAELSAVVTNNIIKLPPSEFTPLHRDGFVVIGAIVHCPQPE
jgi:hypothetical protein